MSRPVAISLRLYRALARAFPYEFKNAYEEELVQVTEDAIEPIWRRHGVLGLLRLLVDIAMRVPAEHLSEVRRDMRYALRMLAGSPGFTAVALISLSLGMCAPTGLFSEINALILRDLPAVPQPGELVTLQAPTSYPVYQRYRARTDLFSATLAYVAPVPFGIAVGGRTERTWGHLVTASYFSTLGVRPALGRFFEEEHAPVVVVSHRFWQSRLGSDPAAVGKTLRINGHPCTVLGVGPQDFLGASPLLFVADVWMPLAVGESVAPELAGHALERRDLKMFQFVGRLRPGVTAPRAEAALDTVARQLAQAYGEEDPNQKGRRVFLKTGGKLVPTRKQDLPMVTAFPTVLMALVLLIACSNVANMMLARAADRRREIAVRLALGAGRARLIRQLLTESMLLAAAAGVLGFLLTVWLMHLCSQMKLPHTMPIDFNVMPDWRVLAFAAVLTVFTGLAFGLAPAIQATRGDLIPALKEGGNVRLRRFRRLSLRNLLVVGQMSASLMLLLLTGILVLGWRKSIGIDVGFDARNLYLLSVDPIRDGYSGERAAAFFQTLLERVRRLPGITAACVTDTVPLTMNGRVTIFTDSRAIHTAGKNVVGTDCFATTGIPILLGRGFRKEDGASDSRAVIVTEKLVREFFNGADPLGRRIETGTGEVARFDMFQGSSFDYRVGQRRLFEVVGVARDVKMESAMERARPAIYFPLHAADYAQPSFQGMTLMVRAAPGVDALRAVRHEIRAMDANLSPFNPRSMTEQIDQVMLPARVGITSYGAMGLFGLILAAVGVAGVTAYSVAQRWHELGIRIALGARRTDVIGLVMREGLGLVAAGAIIGLGSAWAFTRVLSATVEPVAKAASRSTSDPVMLVGAPLLLGALALAACYVPARRSMRIDPVAALRQE